MAKTPVFDWEKKEFVRDLYGKVATTEGAKAVEQIVLKAQQTPRGVSLIYASDDTDRHHKYGSDVEAVLVAPELTDEVRVSELKRAVEEAVIYDPEVSRVEEIQITKEADGYRASYSILSVEGDVVSGEVKFSG